MNKIKDLLLALKKINEDDVTNEQIIHEKYEEFRKHIYTLDGTKREISPMLKERFEFAGKWEDAFLLQTWLSLEEINNYSNIQELVESIKLRMENWEDVPPASVGLSQVSIFGFDPFDTNETYLEWVVGEMEPKIWVFVDGYYHMFNHLENFLKYTIGESQKDDRSIEK